MERLYSVNSSNGRGYNKLNLEYSKKSDDYLLKVINNEESDWEEYIIETIPGICNRCNKDLSEDISDKIKYKLLYPNESLFIFSQRRRNQYYYIYKHYCTCCLNKGLYNWSINNLHNKYPHLRVDGFSFIYNLKNMNDEYIPKKNYPRIYRCEYYLSQGYTYLDDKNKKYTDNQLDAQKKLLNCEMLDIY
tara:strand:+ start:3715 stop:4284 length:570 start_codon:yes stop_codon:yes gene_type:complete